jgi:hypothetical protein
MVQNTLRDSVQIDVSLIQQLVVVGDFFSVWISL